MNAEQFMKEVFGIGEEKAELFCTIEESDVKRFEVITDEKKAIFEMFEQMKKELMKVQKKEKEVWEEIREKYEMPEANLRLDRDTGEVFVVTE